jgi:hypothetical protein
VDGDHRGQLVGARDNNTRTDDEMRQVLDYALGGLDAFDLPDPMDPADARNPWRWNPAWMNAVWLRGVRDLLNWVLGEDYVSPLRKQFVVRPPVTDLAIAEEAAEEVASKGRPGGVPVDLQDQAPQYGEAIQTTIHWIRGEVATGPVDHHSCAPYAG